MSWLKTLGHGQGYAKIGILGFPKSGKTYTATKFAIGIRQHFGHPGPIAMFDTETGSDYVAEIVKKGTGKDLLGVKSRSFDDMMAMARECVSSGVSVLIADSVTHPWRELCDAYLAQKNESLRRLYEEKGWKFTPKQSLELKDWGPIKAKWQQWTDFYLRSALHVIICGRAGFEWDMVENERGKKELEKTGVKMKTESEFGFEPSLLIQMEREQGGDKMRHKAIVIGDRYDVIDGRTAYNPDFPFIKPHIEKLNPESHAPINTDVKTEMDVDENGSSRYRREREKCEIICEEIQGILVKHHPSQSAVDKKAKTELLWETFRTRSWKQVQALQRQELSEGLKALQKRLEPEGDRVALIEEIDRLARQFEKSGGAVGDIIDGDLDEYTEKQLSEKIAALKAALEEAA